MIQLRKTRNRILSLLPVVVAAAFASFAPAHSPILASATGTVRSELRSEPAEGVSAGEASSALAAASAARPNYAISASNLRHWDKRTVTVHVNYALNDTRSEADVLKLVGRSLGLWNSRIGETITLVLTSDANADVQMSFVPAKSLPGGAIGFTDVTFQVTDQVLTHANVRLELGQSNDSLIQVAAHEMGHALGIQGHSDNPKDLMYAYAHTPAIITQRDLNTMSISYGIDLSHPNSAIATMVSENGISAPKSSELGR